MAISNLTQGLRSGVCTSTTRPVSPYEGQHIYETDTDKVLVWNGSAWYPNWNLPWGIVAITQSSTADTTITTEEVQLTSPAFTAVANRYYKITYFEPQIYSPSVAAVAVAVIRKGTTTAGTQLVQTAVSLAGNQYAPLNPSVITTLTAGSQQVCALLYVTAGTGQTTRSAVEYAYLLVEDIGPA